jgi:hypothetical protein
MPRLPIDYSKSIIYSIVSKTDETLLYVGSTTDFIKRKASHKSITNNVNSNRYNLQLYIMIRANGGWDAFDMKPVKEYPCENKIQLTIEEERIRKEMNANLNTLRAHITKEEMVEVKKVYKMLHKEKIAEQNKEYYHQNKEQYFENTKRYREENRDKINQQRREKYKE